MKRLFVYDCLLIYTLNTYSLYKYINIYKYIIDEYLHIRDYNYHYYYYIPADY